MKIGELSKRSGLAASRIRFYEREGLLQLVERQANGYRTYPEEALVVLNLIEIAQDAGFSLDEIRDLVPSNLMHWEHGKLEQLLREKVRSIEVLETRLARNKATILELLTQIETKPEDMTCATNARQVLSRMGFQEIPGSG